MSDIGRDANGPYRVLSDGRALRVNERPYNTLLTLSSSVAAWDWIEGW